MRVFITGATGFIGRALVPLLRRDGHTVEAWVRSDARARNLLGAEVDFVPASGGPNALKAAVERADAVVNLAGEPLMGGRWTAARRAVLEESRVNVTADIVHAMTGASRRPRVLVSGSAVGFYGDRGEEILSESTPGGIDFLAALCRRWEKAAQAAESLGVRVVLLRTGVALGRDGGALASMRPPFEFGLGGPIGSGRQYLPWIHLLDLVRIIAAALVDDRYRGPINGVAPEPATNRAFTRELARALHRPAIAPVPPLALKAIFGKAATVLLASQRVEPAALRQFGFSFAFPTLERALADVLGGADVTIARLPSTSGQSGYELRTKTLITAPLAEAFDFFSKAENLGLITPAAMRLTIDEQAPLMSQGASIAYSLRVGPVPVRWRTRISVWEPNRRFVDLQESGPYRVWRHEHTFRAEGDRTVMEDRVQYAPPLGPLGRLAHTIFIGPALMNVFRYRGDVIRLRFGS